MINRRSFIAASAVTSVWPIHGRAASSVIRRYEGEMTPATFSALAAQLEATEDEVIGLRISVDANGGAVGSTEDEEGLSIFTDDGDYNLHFSKDFSLIHGVYQIDGFFTVEYAGMYQGITALHLEAVDKGAVLLSGHTIENVDLSSQ